MGRDWQVYNYNLVAGVEQEITLSRNTDSLTIKARNANDVQLRRDSGAAAYYNLNHVWVLTTNQIKEYFPNFTIFATCGVNEVFEIVATHG